MATLHKPQIIKQTRTATFSWRTTDDIKVHDLANALRKIQPEAILDSLTVETADEGRFMRLRVEYLADTAAEERRIIECYRNYDPLDYLDPLRNRD